MVLSGKHAVVTGGSRGIGFEVSKLFLDNGASVLAVSRDPGHLAGAAERLPGLQTLAADASFSGDIDRVAAWVDEHWGRLDILINNAGISLAVGLPDQPDANFETTMRVNVLGPYLCMKRLLPLLLKSEQPRIVNVGSFSGIVSPLLKGSYGVSKAALHALSVAFANELRGKVAVNAMCPGWVRTDMSPNAPGAPKVSAEHILWQVCQPMEVTGGIFRDKIDVGYTPSEIVPRMATIASEGPTPR